MRIAICGDSFFCADSYYKNTHFSELLAKDHEVINYACPGVSGLAICSQIDSAIQLKPDVIVAKSSYPGRIEILKDKTTEYVFENKINNFDQNRYTQISNQEHFGHFKLSDHIDHSQSTLISENLSVLLDKEFTHLDDETFGAFEKVIPYFSLEWHKQVTTWSYAHLVRKCSDFGILILFDCNADVEMEYNDFDFIPDSQKIYLGDILPLEPLPDDYMPRPIYHTDYITQQNIYSYLLEKFKEHKKG